MADKVRYYGDDIGGVWRTIGGRRVFIRDGEGLAEAMKRSGKFARYTKEGEKEGNIRYNDELLEEYRNKSDEELEKLAKNGSEPQKEMAKKVLENKKAIKQSIAKSNTALDDNEVGDSLAGHIKGGEKYVDAKGVERIRGGKLDPKREQMHQEIIGELFEGKVAPDEEKTMYFTGGGSGTGKSNLVKNYDQKYYDTDFKFNKDTELLESNVVKIDPDQIKDMIYHHPLYDDDMKYDAAYLHEESSALSKRALKVAQDNGLNIMYDTTGDGTAEKMAKKINAAKELGYKTQANYVTADFELALERNVERYEKKLAKADETARLVPSYEVAKIHRGTTNTLVGVADLYDKVDLYDMTDYKNPIKIASGGSGKKLTIEKGQEALYNKFLSKGEKTDDELTAIADKFDKENYEKIKEIKRKYGVKK